MLESTVTLIIFLFPLAYSPGPGNMFFAASGARFGFQKTIPAILGYHVATWLITFAIGYGFLEIAENYPNAFLYISYAGVFYVLYLAWSFFHADRTDGKQAPSDIGFWDGAILLVLNPKAYVIISTMFSQFLAPESHLFLVIWITTVFTLNNLLAFCLWGYVGDRLLSRFRQESNERRLNIALGCVLVGVALWMLFKLAEH